MKFAYFSASPIMKNGLMPGFEKNGHETVLYPMACIGDSMVTVERDGAPLRISYREQELINEYIDRCICDARPDHVVLEGYQEQLAAGIYQACKKYGCGFIYWSIEDPVGFQRTLPLARIADYTFTTAIECIPQYEKQGVSAHLLMFACNPDYHSPGKYNAQYDLDFAAQASWYSLPSRVAGYETLLKPLLDLGLNCKIWGFYWDTDPEARKFLGEHYDKWSGILPNSELPHLCASSKIVLGFQCDSSSITQTSMRNYEVLACGGFYLCQYSKASEHLFREGEHLELVRNAKEAVEKALYYIGHEKERRQIALQGQQFVHSRHTYEVRVRDDVLPYMK